MTIQEKLNQFMTDWKGKKLEAYDPSNPYQCYDLVTKWTRDYLSIAPPMTLYAYQIFTNYPTGYIRIENAADNKPLAGDVIVWGSGFNNGAGHTGVATGKGLSTGLSTDWFEAFVQNDPIGSPCILKNYSYANVLGWVRPPYVETDALAECLIQHQSLMKELDGKKQELVVANQKIADLKQTEIRLQKEKTEIQTESTSLLAKKDVECQAQIKALKDKVIEFARVL